jgi:hypothetical protein
MKLPNDWAGTLGAGFRGRVRYTRHFNRPTGLEPREKVWLVVEGADARGDVQLNGQALGEVRGYALPASFDFTTLIAPRNELVIDVELPPPDASDAAPRPGREDRPGGLIRDVRLEIRVSAWLDDLCMYALPGQPRATLHLTGDLKAGPPDGPFNLLITADRRELYFGPVELGRIDVLKEVEDLPRWAPGVPNHLGTVDVSLLQRGEAVWEASLRTALCNIASVSTKQATVLNEIMSEEDYARLDASGQPILQHVPAAWAETVCRRLAHHPSIVAWTAPQDELQQIERGLRPDWFGRPWLPLET